MVIKESVLPRRPPKNPQPCIVEGGDCGACVLAGVLGITPLEVYDLHESGRYSGGGDISKLSAFNFHSMYRTLKKMASITQEHCSGVPRRLEHALVEIPIWPFTCHEMNTQFGLPGKMQSRAWLEHAKAMVSSGYYGIAQVKNGGKSELKNYGETDHWLTIAGWRCTYETSDVPVPHGTYKTHILIADSALSQPLEQWITAHDFLNVWGGFAAFWAKPL